MIVRFDRTLAVLPLFSAFLALSLFSTHRLIAQYDADLHEVASNLEVPVDLEWGSDNYIWVAERAGTISRVDPESGTVRVVLSLPDVLFPDSRGLLGMSLHPDFADDPRVFLLYQYRSYHDGGWHDWSKLVHYTYDATDDTLLSPTMVLDSLPANQWVVGGGVLAQSDGSVFLGIGDGVNFLDEVQNPDFLRGKILRVGMDGSLPNDNPYTDLPWPSSLIYSIGHRNAKAIGPGPNGALLSLDWGTNSLDELNELTAGRNCGWPDVKGDCDGFPNRSEFDFCDESMFSDPIHQWYVARPHESLVSDFVFLAESGIGHWRNSVIVATLEDGIHQLKLYGDSLSVRDEARYVSPQDFDRVPGRFRAICASPDGRVFAATSNRDGDAKPPLPHASDDRIVEIVSAEKLVPTTELLTRDVATGLDVPWEIAWGTDNMIWMTERAGTVSRIDPVTGDRFRILSLPNTFTNGNAGLLGMALHPNFCDSPYVFLAHCYPRPDNSSLAFERLVRYRYDEARDTLIDEQTLIDSILASYEHAGSRLVIDSDRTLYMTTGDGNQAHYSQRLDKTIGKVYRIKLDGTVPPDNPWADSSWPASAVYSMGHRNPQGLAIGPDGKLYSSEHGTWTDDELNRLEPGGNFGWPDVWGFCDEPEEIEFCKDSNVVEPLMTWTPTIAPGGIEYYDHHAIPEWTGSLLLSVQKESHVRSLPLDTNSRTIDTSYIYFPYEFGRIRDLCVAPDGRVFLAITNGDGIGHKRAGDDRIVEVSSGRGHPDLPAPGTLCDRQTDAVPESTAYELEISITVAPHPVMDRSVIHIEPSAVSGTITIWNTAGRIVREQSVGAGEEMPLDADELPPGTYFIELNTSRGKISRAVLVR